MVSVVVGSEGTFDPGEQRVLFPWTGGLDNDRWDVAPDGQRFLFVRTVGEFGNGKVIVVENWLEELKALVPN